jgi:hypothetical protein
MSDQPPRLSETSAVSPPRKKPKGFFPPKIVKAVAFYIISLCIVASVLVSILAIWDFTKKDSLYRLIASFIVVAGGTALFAAVNGVFGEERDS